MKTKFSDHDIYLITNCVRDQFSVVNEFGFWGISYYLVFKEKKIHCINGLATVKPINEFILIHKYYKNIAFWHLYPDNVYLYSTPARNLFISFT